MKRQLNIFERFNVYIRWVLTSQNILVSICSLCDSRQIKRTYSTDDFSSESKVTYTATYTCLSCKSTAEVEEIWFRRNKE